MPGQFDFDERHPAPQPSAKSAAKSGFFGGLGCVLGVVLGIGLVVGAGALFLRYHYAEREKLAKEKEIKDRDAQAGVAAFELGQSAEIGYARVAAVEAGVGVIRYESGGLEVESKEPRLWLRMKIENLHKTKKLSYATWRGHWLDVARDAMPVARMSDEHNNDYLTIKYDRTNRDGGAGYRDVYPGESITDMLYFQRPIALAKILTVYLQGENVGEKSSALRLTIHAAKLRLGPLEIKPD